MLNVIYVSDYTDHICTSLCLYTLMLSTYDMTIVMCLCGLLAVINTVCYWLLFNICGVYLYKYYIITDILVSLSWLHDYNLHRLQIKTGKVVIH